ncbi:MAG: phycobilisome rod-core linker polypeptide [Synechococcaceae cyanobacterium]|nr:phycobilisome rod-core linker polypeptide [Synechococcaceae cyanobacterium]
MSLPLLNVAPRSLNARVNAFAVGGDETPRQTPQNRARGAAAVDEIIEQAYRQIYFHAFRVDRDPVLESQLRSNQITVRDFVRGLLLSSKFRDDFYRCNSNYRMVEQVVGRVLGRPVHGDQERIALSILIAQHGLPALVDTLLDSQEYLDNFGYDQVPFQRSRVLAGQAQGQLPFNQEAPRYERYWREATVRRAPAGSGSGWSPSGGMPRPAWLADAPSPLARSIWQGIVATTGFVITGFVLYTAAVMLSTASAG